MVPLGILRGTHDWCSMLRTMRISVSNSILVFLYCCVPGFVPYPLRYNLLAKVLTKIHVCARMSTYVHLCLTMTGVACYGQCHSSVFKWTLVCLYCCVTSPGFAPYQVRYNFSTKMMTKIHECARISTYVHLRLTIAGVACYRQCRSSVSYWILVFLYCCFPKYTNLGACLFKR